MARETREARQLGTIAVGTRTFRVERSAALDAQYPYKLYTEEGGLTWLERTKKDPTILTARRNPTLPRFTDAGGTLRLA